MYRLYGDEDRLLYVGMSGNVERRLREHASDKFWWPEVKRTTISRAPSRAGAVYEESVAIMREDPIHNRDVPSLARLDRIRTEADEALPGLTDKERIEILENLLQRAHVKSHGLGTELRQAVQNIQGYTRLPEANDGESSRTGGLLSQAVRLLESCGVSVVSGTSDTLSLRLDNGSLKEVCIHVQSSPKYGNPAKVDERIFRVRGRRLLWVVDRPTESVLKAAFQDRMDLVTLRPEGVVIDGKQQMERHLMRAVVTQTSSRIPWGRFAVMRLLILAQDPFSQVEIATMAGISQPGVFKIMKQLEKHVRRGDDGWYVPGKEALLDEWIESYPGPGGWSSHWKSPAAPVPQAAAAAAYATEMEVDCLISGDPAADVYAPWRLPAMAQIYLREAIDLTRAGFTACQPEEATLITTVPKDATVWATACTIPREAFTLADPLITLRDVQHSIGSDVPDAVARLRRAVSSLDRRSPNVGW